jgi:hypothetical protein
VAGLCRRRYRTGPAFSGRHERFHGRPASQQSADVTEGWGGIWERLHYDWSDPNRVTLTTTDSNTWAGASGYVYTLSPRPDGTTNVDVVIVREGKNFKGRVLAAVLATIGKGVIRKAFVHSVKAIETRSDASTSAS